MKSDKEVQSLSRSVKETLLRINYCVNECLVFVCTVGQNMTNELSL